MSKADRLMDEVATRLLAQDLVPGLLAENVTKGVVRIEALKPDEYPHVFLWDAAEESELTEAWRQELRTLSFLIDVCLDDADDVALRQILSDIQADFVEVVWDPPHDTLAKAPEWITFAFPDRSERVGRLTFAGQYAADAGEP